MIIIYPIKKKIINEIKLFQLDEINSEIIRILDFFSLLDSRGIKLNIITEIIRFSLWNQLEMKTADLETEQEKHPNVGRLFDVIVRKKEEFD